MESLNAVAIMKPSHDDDVLRFSFQSLAFQYQLQIERVLNAQNGHGFE